MRKVAVSIAGREATLGGAVEVAETGFTRMRGLLGRKSLAPGEGLWIRPSSGVHTFGMQFPIDVIGLDASMTVVKLWQELRPQRMTALNLRTRSVLELPAGLIAQTGVKVGDKITMPAAGTGAAR